MPYGTPDQTMNKGGKGKQASQPSPGQGYSTEAHSDSAHGKGGEAVGAKKDFAPMEYGTKTHAEGATSEPVAGQPGGKGNVGMAEHHAHPRGEAHSFSRQPATNAHGYGHSGGQRQGPLRTSGHSGAHQIGCKKK